MKVTDLGRSSAHVIKVLELKCFEFTKQLAIVPLSFQFQLSDSESLEQTFRLSGESQFGSEMLSFSIAILYIQEDL